MREDRSRNNESPQGRIGGSPKIFPILLAMLQAPEEEVRLGVLSGLGALHDSRGYDAIIERLDDRRLRYAAIMALGDLGDPRACELLVPMLQVEMKARPYMRQLLLEK